MLFARIYCGQKQPCSAFAGLCLISPSGQRITPLASRPKDIDMFNPIKKAISAIWAYLNKNRNLIILWKPTIKTIVVLEKDGNSMK